MIASHCPDRDSIQDYLSGRLANTTAAELEQHFGRCPACEQVLDELETEPDSLVGALQTWPANSDAELNQQNTADLAAQRFAASLASRLRPASSLELNTAPTIGGYELIRLLGRGGMGTVYLARHQKLDKQVAIKVLPVIMAQRHDIVARFQREIRATGRLEHASIIRATDAGECDGVHFLVMDAVDGLDCGKLCRIVGPLPIADACEIARQTALGLAYAHSQGIVHRDIKPSNLMLDVRGQVRITDFGLAQMAVWKDEIAELTTVGQLMGTLDYMAPEQAEPGAVPDERADIYALGATLFRLLCNRTPLSALHAITPIEKLRLISNHHPIPIDTLRDDLPPELSRLVMQMLSRSAHERPATAKEVADRLSAFSQDANLVSLIARAQASARDQSKTPVAAVTTTEQRSAQPKQPPSQPPSNVWKWIALACGAAIAWAGMLFALETSKGRLVIDSKGANLQVRLLKDGQEYRDLTIHPGAQVTKLYSGNYEIIIDTPSDRFSVSESKFTIKMGETVVATLSELPQLLADRTSVSAAVAPNQFTFMNVQPKTITLEQPYVGQILSHHHIELRAPREAVVAETRFREGQDVISGELLFELLPTRYDTDLDVLKAEMKQAEIRAQNTKSLFDKKVVSDGELALANAGLEEAHARLKQSQAERAPIAITAPFSGVVGRVRYQKGSRVEEGETLTTLSDNSEMWVYFNVPEVRHLQYDEGKQLQDQKIELVLADGEKFERDGKLGVVEADFNPQTGNIAYRADFPNPSRKLRHGQTGTVVVSRVFSDAVVIPQRATFEVLDQRYVFVVDEANVVHQREIVIADELDDAFVVKSGVSANDKIILEGIRSVRDGEKLN